MNILITAFAFEPCETSEPGAAWRFANIAAREHKVNVLTGGFPGPAERTRKHLEEHPELRIEAVPFWPRGFPKCFGWHLINIHYWLWHRQLIRPAMALHRNIGFNVIHHVTLSRYWVGSSVCRMPVPLIWGPVGSGGSTPQSLARELPLRAKIPNLARELAASICRRDPLLKNTLQKASVCFSMNRDTTDRLRLHGVTKVEELPQICFSEERLQELSKVPAPPEVPPIRLLSVGRILYWKGFQYGIRAAAELKRRGVPFQYRIAGWGPYEGALGSLISELRLTNEVQLVGRMTNEELMANEMRMAHVLLHPALHESFGNVCLEALASARPVICLNTGGPASQVDETCGYAVSVANTEESVAEIATAVEQLFRDPERIKTMGLAAQRRARNFFHAVRLQEEIEKAYITAGTDASKQC